jgi:hypothetical protein
VEVGAHELSRDERILLTACEFWAAACREKLDSYCGAEPLVRLGAATYSFSRLGAIRVVSVLRIAMQALECRDSTSATDSALRRLYEQLQQQSDNVEERIATFACSTMAVDISDSDPAVDAEVADSTITA